MLVSNNNNVSPISKVVENSKDKNYDVILNNNINKFKIEIKFNDFILNEDVLINLSYNKNNDKIIIDNLLSSLIFKYDNNFHKYINIKYDNSVLYIFLLPLLTSNNEYIIKIGYTDNLHKRKKELLREFNIDNIYLIYCCDIKNEYRERKIHKIIKKYTKYYYPVIKNKKYNKKNKIIIKNENKNNNNDNDNDKNNDIYKIIINELSNLYNDENNEKIKNINKISINSDETYIFSYNILNFVLNILYQMNRLDDNYLIELNIENKKLDNNSKKLDIDIINAQNNGIKLNNDKINAETNKINAENERIIVISLILVIIIYLFSKVFKFI